MLVGEDSVGKLALMVYGSKNFDTDPLHRPFPPFLPCRFKR